MPINKFFISFLLLILPASALAFGFGDLTKSIKNIGSSIGETTDADTSLVTGYTYEQEREIGKRLTGCVLGAAKLVDNAKLQRYINLVGRWVSMHSDRPDIDWVFGLIESDTINAFAAPGGFILITKGLLQELDSEAQLAAVLGHEIAHVTEYHRLNLLRKSTGISFGGKKLLDKIRGKGGDAEFIVENLVGNGAELMARGLDKNAEHQADIIGMQLSAKSGYSSLGMAEVVLALAEKPTDGESTKMLFSTHPLPQKRLDEIDRNMDEELDGKSGQPVLTKRFKKRGVIH